MKNQPLIRSTVLEPHLMAIRERFGTKRLSQIVRMCFRRYAKTASSPRAATVDMCRIGIAQETGCSIAEAQELALGVLDLNLNSKKGIAILEDPHYFSPQIIGTNRPLVARRVQIESLPEMPSAVMQATANVATVMDPWVRDWYDSMDAEMLETLGITERLLDLLSWAGDRDIYSDVWRDPNTRQYITVGLSRNGDETQKAVVLYAESVSVSDEALQDESDHLHREFGVNLDNCDEVVANRDTWASRIGALGVASAYHLGQARDTGTSRFISRRDRSMALGQDQGITVNCETTMCNTNIRISSEYVDTWNAVLNIVSKRCSDILRHLDTSRHRKLIKMPGTPMGYMAGVPSGSKALFSLGDDTRSVREISASSDSNVLDNAKPHIRMMVEEYLASRNLLPTNKNALDLVAKKIASQVKRGMGIVVPAINSYGAAMKLAAQTLGEECSYTTVTEFHREYCRWVDDDRIDEDTGVVESIDIETTLWSARMADRGFDAITPISCAIKPLIERPDTSNLWLGPVTCFGQERGICDHTEYNAPFTVTDNHDELQAHMGNMPEVHGYASNALVWAHCREDTPYRQLVRKANEVLPLSKRIKLPQVVDAARLQGFRFHF